MNRIAVIGSTGATGVNLVDQALTAGDDVIAIARNPRSVRGAGQQVVDVTLDLARATPQTMAQALHGASAVVFAAAGDPHNVDHRGAVLAIDAAASLGIARFVLLSAKGAGVQRPDWLHGGFWDTYFGAKEAAELYLRGSGLLWTIIRPGELTNGPATGQVALGDADLPFDTIARADVAATLLAVIDDDRASGHAWEVVGGTTPITEAISRQAHPRGDDLAQAVR